MSARHDPRYVASDDPRAVLRAWAGASLGDLTMDMGGWTDRDGQAFHAAIQDESRHAAGEPFACVRIELVTPEPSSSARTSAREWIVTCSQCGHLAYLGPEPVLCPHCQNPDIDTEPS